MKSILVIKLNSKGDPKIVHYFEMVEIPKGHKFIIAPLNKLSKHSTWKVQGDVKPVLSLRELDHIYYSFEWFDVKIIGSNVNDLMDKLEDQYPWLSLELMNYFSSRI